MKKKVLGLLLSISMLAACLAGCGNQAVTDGGAATDAGAADTASADTGASAGGSEKVVILYPGEETDAMANFINNELNPRLAEEVGIQVELIYKGWDQYWEQKDIMLAANETIDLYWDGLPDLSSMVNKSQCQPLDDLIKANCPGP